MSNESVVDIQATEKQYRCSTSECDASVSESVVAIPKDSQDLNSSSKEVKTVRNSVNRSSDAGESCATTTIIVDDETKISENNKDKCKLWVVDIKCGEDDEKLCRICHLNSEQPWKLPFFAPKTDLIVLGCECKGELGVAHSYCAEAWFKLKGNRVCEICGVTANNVRGVGNESFMEEWKDSRTNGIATDSSDTSAEGCWHGQPLCNFLMACLVIAFVLPWFFRINMF